MGRRRGLANVAIQVYLIAAVINLERLAKALGPYFYWQLIMWSILRPEGSF